MRLGELEISNVRPLAIIGIADSTSPGFNFIMFERSKHWAKNIKNDTVALSIAGRDPRTPWYAKVLALFVAAYAISPIDLIPDFVPIIGYLDDLIIVPLGILLAIRLIPPDLMKEFREEALRRQDRPKSYAGVAIIITIWSITAVGLTSFFWPLVGYSR